MQRSRQPPAELQHHRQALAEPQLSPPGHRDQRRRSSKKSFFRPASGVCGAPGGARDLSLGRGGLVGQLRQGNRYGGSRSRQPQYGSGEADG
ncbi:MAG: hypothetical protein MZV70_05685 [Desulfobacterales bacterium]|nr:hypothetical protein [Desulfobacterales bacterium]